MPRSKVASLSLFALLVATAAALPACAAAPEEGDDAEGSSDEIVSSSQLASATIVERSRFRHEGSARGEQDGTSLVSYRFNGFGDTKVRIKVRAKDAAFAPTVVLAGPIPGKETQVVLQRRGTSAGGLELEATLPARGAYRMIVGTESALKGRRGKPGAFDVDFTCLASCDLPEITLADVIADLKATQGEAKVKQGIGELLAAHVTDPELRGKIASQLLALVEANADPNAAAPFIPMSLLGAAQGLFEHAPPSAAPRVEASRPLDVELSEIGADCKVTRSTSPAALSPSLPGLSISDVPDFTYDDCGLARLEGLAAALNALSLDDGSVVRDRGARYETPAALADALLAQGHRIVVDNARYYADFLGLNYQGKTVRAPVWIDTGIPLPGGGTLRTPAPHAHHNFYVSGPRFDGQLKFYMGVDGGTSFRTQSSVPRHWSGGKAEYTIDAASRPDDVRLLLTTAAALRKKWTAAGASLPMQGYGRLGVCTDSTAVLEHRLRGTVTLFPLAHPALASAPQDDVEKTLAALPSDTRSFDRADALKRIGATIPFANVGDVPFPAFVSAWRSLSR